MTMNGRTRWCVVPSIVTWSSCMHSSSAACVFGEARLISSTRSRFANTGPGRNSNSFERWLKTFTPVTSDGSRSGVNWMRENDASSERASTFASIVLPTPGKSSMIRCPSLTRQRTQSWSASSGACTTEARFSTIRLIVSAPPASAWTRSLPGSLTQQLLRPVDDRRRDQALRGLLEPLLAAGRDERDLVLVRVEADVVAGHVVEDDEVEALVAELLARALEPRLAVVGCESDPHLPVATPFGQRSDDVRRRRELERPGVLVLRALVGALIGRGVVGGSGRHQHEVGVAPLERGVQHRFRRGRLDDLDAGRRCYREVRR